MKADGEMSQEPADPHPAVDAQLGTVDGDKKADQQEHQVEAIREHLGGLLTELDRRRHAVSPARLARHFPFAAVLGVATLAGVAAGAIAWKVRQSKRDNTLPRRISRLKLAVRRAVNRPEQVAKPEPNLPMKVATAIAVTAAGAITKRLIVRYFAQSSQP